LKIFLYTRLEGVSVTRAIKSYLGSRACVDVDFHVLN
jgi:hypothetical protein